jgi:prephenate dehydrogenase
MISDTDLAVLAVPASIVPDMVETLVARNKPGIYILSLVLVKKPTKGAVGRTYFGNS